MKSLLKNVLRRISKKQSSKEDNATAFYPQCCAKVDDSARMRIKMSYDQNVKETISVTILFSATPILSAVFQPIK